MSATIRPRPRPKIASRNGPPSTGKGITKPPRHISDEGRQKLSELAIERHKRGDFKPTPGGKPKKKRKPSKARVSQLVAQAAVEKKTASQIIQVFKDGISDHQPIQIRLKAAEAWLRVDENDAKLDLKRSSAEDEHMGREAALSYLAEALSSGHASDLVRKRIQSDDGDIEGEAHDI